MKKWIAILCTVALVFSVAGCGQTKEASMTKLLSEKPAGEITVSCYNTMIYKDYLEKEAKAFEKENPGTKIKVETFAPMPDIKESKDGNSSIAIVTSKDDSQERTNYISKINTELMSGKGADVLAMDILPYYKYAGGGQLEDLQEYMKADGSFNIKDYRKNIMDAVKYHGGQYMIPLDYNFDYLAYDKSLFTEQEQQNMGSGSKYTYAQLFDAGKGPFQRVNAGSREPVRILGTMAGPQMFHELFRVDYGTFINMADRKVNLTDGSFAELLKTAREYGNEGYLNQDPGSKQSSEISLDDFKKMKQQKFFFKEKNCFSLLSEALKSAGTDGAGASSFDIGAGDESNDVPLGLLTNKNGDVNFQCMQAYGINSNSDNKALAWAFIKFLLSEKQQSDSQMFMVGYPVNNAARMEKAKNDISGMSFNNGAASSDGVNQTGELTAEQQKAYDLYVKSIEKFSDSLNCCPILDDTISTMIRDETAHYFDGSKTADQVAKNLQDKIELYLNE
jgi:ABC-type sugar transport system, periplasmic component